MRMHNPAHPGQILREYMGDAYTVSGLAKSMEMTRANLSMILNGRLGISAAVALKLADVFPNSDAEFWLALQTQYDLAALRKKLSQSGSSGLKKAAVSVAS
jgi:addiction module HigA family antidote